MSLNGPAMMDLGHCVKSSTDKPGIPGACHPNLEVGGVGEEHTAHCRNVAGNIWRSIIGTQYSIPVWCFNCT